MQDKSELIFVLANKKPGQLSVARLAAYMKEFATLLGAKGMPMFSAIRSGSTCVAVTFAESGGLTTARKRAHEASRGFGPKEAQNAFDTLTTMAAEDRTPARVVAKSGTVVHFPRSHNYHRPLSVHERGSVTGRITGMVDEKTGGARVRIRPTDGGPLVYATASSQTADGLGKFFRQHVRIHGFGEWKRSDTGGWVCAGIEIDEIYPVENVTVLDAVKSLREVKVDWLENPFDGLDSDANLA